MKKAYSRVLSIILACLLTVTFLPATAYAAGAETDGICGADGDNLTWTLDPEGTLTVSGTGKMADWGGENGDAPWYRQRDAIQKVIIKEGVTSIGDEAFLYCDSILSAEIADSVTRIGISAFLDCESLTTVNIPTGLTEICDQAFAVCYSLQNVEIPNGVTRIGYCAFADCLALTSVTIPASVTFMDQNVFYECTSLQEILVDEENEYFCSVDGMLFSKDQTAFYTFPAGRTDTSYSLPVSVTTIRGAAFAGCVNLQSVTIPDGLEVIEDWAFGYAGLTSICLPASVSHIGESVFVGCESLSEISVDGENRYYFTDDDVLFNKDVTELIFYPAFKNDTTEYSIPETVSAIFANAFAFNTTLEKVAVPSGVTEFHRNTFYLCKNLETVNIPDGVTDIGYCAFCCCYSLKDVRIPDSVERIEGYAFSDCSSLESIVIPGSVQSVEYSAFEYCTALKSVTMEDGVGSFGSWVFDHCTSLESVSIPGSVGQLPYCAFYQCTALTSVTVGEGVTNIEERAFEGCTSLQAVIIPDSVTAIGESAFGQCGRELVLCCSENSAAHGYAVQNDLSCKLSGKTESYAVTVAEAENGAISASVKSAHAGKIVTLTVTHASGYRLETIFVTDAEGNNIELKAPKVGKTYTFRMPASDVTVEAAFMEDSTMLNYFVDVTAGDYFYDPVLWAAENEITSGVDDSHFAPDGTTTRAQMVTFLWRTAGCPEPASAECLFMDVEAEAYYYKAVLWAVENGITDGTSDTEFEPNAFVTRAQAVTFLYRCGSCPDVTGNTVFTDVASGEYYYDAVLWAIENGITEGTSETTFSPDETCTRAQSVTFLYRTVSALEQ